MRQPDRFEIHPPMLLAGLRRTYTFDEAPRDIPRDWERFVQRLPLRGQVGETSYGAVCGADMAAETMEYMPSVQVETFDGLPDDLGRMRVPEARYAVFVHPGPVSDIRETIGAAHAWLADNGDWKDARTPDFERYGPGYDRDTGRGDIEIWLPVIARD